MGGVGWPVTSFRPWTKNMPFSPWICDCPPTNKNILPFIGWWLVETHPTDLMTGILTKKPSIFEKTLPFFCWWVYTKPMGVFSRPNCTTHTPHTHHTPPFARKAHALKIVGSPPPSPLWLHSPSDGPWDGESPGDPQPRWGWKLWISNAHRISSAKSFLKGARNVSFREKRRFRT